MDSFDDLHVKCIFLFFYHCNNIVIMDKSIEDYNVYLVKTCEDTLNIIDYFSKIHRTFFPEIDISFMNYFLDLSNPSKINEFCIYEKDLRKYGLIDERMKPRELVTKYNLMQHVDWMYHGHHEEEKHHIFYHLGVYIHNETKRNIVFTPKAFKKIILQSSNITFVEYYMLLETVMRYYHDYQIKYVDKQKNKKKIELEQFQQECSTYEMRIEEYETYIEKIVKNVNDTMNRCKDEIQSIVHITKEKKEKRKEQ